MDHVQEWQQSCVDPELIQLNVISLEGDRPLDYLLYSEALPRRNDGRLGTVTSSAINTPRPGAGGVLVLIF